MLLKLHQHFSGQLDFLTLNNWHFSEKGLPVVVYDQNKSNEKYKQMRRIVTSSVYYVIAKIGSYVLKDIDLLPLRDLTWQTDKASIC